MCLSTNIGKEKNNLLFIEDFLMYILYSIFKLFIFLITILSISDKKHRFREEKYLAQGDTAGT
jgi:hypothetical protein